MQLAEHEEFSREKSNAEINQEREKDRLKNRDQIVDKLMNQYQDYLHEIAEAARPDFINLVDRAWELHLNNNCLPVLRSAIQQEEAEKVHMNGELKKLKEFK
jgi:vacuolar-type H+-ATPase subunit E/Vma4